MPAIFCRLFIKDIAVDADTSVSCILRYFGAAAIINISHSHFSLMQYVIGVLSQENAARLGYYKLVMVGNSSKSCNVPAFSGASNFSRIYLAEYFVFLPVLG